MPNKLSQFWQELKRRNVVRVITVYAGAAFVIIELINNITEPLHLPEWTPTLVIVLLAIGFPIAIIFSWIYDVRPEEGIVKTAPARKVKPEDIPKSSNGWKIASYISFVVILGLILLNVFPRNEKKAILETSIAVLPLIDLSNSEEISSIGFTDEIIMELQKVKDFDRVLSLTSTMQYAEQRPTISEIGEKLNVNYLVEGTIQKKNDIISINIKIIIAKEDAHIWAEEFDEPWESRFLIQDKIALRVAEELQAVITPNERELIEERLTTNLTANDFYQRGREEYFKIESSFQIRQRGFLRDAEYIEVLERAEYYFSEVLKYDSTFAQAYTGLARIYWGSESYLSENYLDTVRVLLDKALSFNQGLAEAHTLYGRYFNTLNDTIRAMREVDKAISINPNDWEAYSIKADMSSDYINKIRNNQKAVMLNRGHELPGLLTRLGNSYWNIGFLDKGAVLYEKVLKLTGDSITYLYQIADTEYFRGNTNRSLQLFKRSLELDSTQLHVYAYLFQFYHYLGEIDQALKYGKVWVDGMKASGGLWVNYVQRVGLFYRLQGLEAEAKKYFNLQIEYCLREIELGRNRAERNLNTYYDLATTYAATGDTQKAIENLRIWITRPILGLRLLWYISDDPILNPIRDEPEYQQILKEAEAKYQVEHERVRQWLEENEML